MTARLLYQELINQQVKKENRKKIVSDMMNHTRLPKEVLLPEWACRYVQVANGDRA